MAQIEKTGVGNMDLWVLLTFFSPVNLKLFENEKLFKISFYVRKFTMRISEF